jgi:hypothetical protein
MCSSLAFDTPGIALASLQPARRFRDYSLLIAIKLFRADLVRGDACASQRPLHRFDHRRRADDVLHRRGQVADQPFQHIRID